MQFGRKVYAMGLPVLAALLVVGCEEQTAPTSAQKGALTPSDHKLSHPSDLEGAVFRARLKPLNSRWSDRSVTGTAVVQANEGILTVSIQARGLDPGRNHPQHIHGLLSGDEGGCPGPQADGDRSGAINVGEGLPSYGPVLVSLDTVTLDDGPGATLTDFPLVSDSKGRLDYTMSGSISAINAALDLAFGITLGPLANRSIVLHAVDSDTDLPADANVNSIPVACGALEPVD